MALEFKKINKVKGELELPGDKSISHRAVMFSALALGESKIYNLSNGQDVKSTCACFRKLGIEIEEYPEFISVKGKGFKGFKAPDDELNCGNSGTTARLISGILAAQDFETILTGDDSLSARPMKRIITPLAAMGAKIYASEKFTLPLKISPADKISAINYELPVASAQVKSAVLLAGLHSEGTTTIVEKIPSRDHTERMLGLKTELTGKGKISYVSKKDYPAAKEYHVPSDISTAAFFIVLALLAQNSSLIIKNVSLNETRTGVLTVLKKMGGEIEIDNVREYSGEKMGDLVIKSSSLRNIEINEELIPNIIDEIPILAVAGILAEGEFSISNAKELRGKETDRINALCRNLEILGLDVIENDDGFSFTGEVKNEYPIFKSYGDHRIAMSFGILSLLLKKGGGIDNFSCADISNPNFLVQLNSITA